jgi:hypothetical protein
MSFALSTVALIGLGVSAAGGAAKAIDGGIQARNAKKKAEEAQIDLDKQKASFASLDTSNPYLNMENTMEDLTVNKQQAEFQKQQAMQSQANVMQSMRGAAGGSGIAALAQTLANSGSLDAQKASVSIGNQEADNQRLERAEASRIQGLGIDGEIISRQAEKGKISTLMGMAADDVSNANQARAEAKSDMHKGIATVGSSLTSMGGVGGGEKTTEVLPDGTVNVVGGTAPVGGISTPENVTGQPEVQGWSGSDVSWDAGNVPPQFGYVNGVWQQIN